MQGVVKMRKKSSLFISILFIAVLFTSSTIAATSSDNAKTKPIVYTINIENTITAGTSQYIARAIETAEDENAAALVLLINTPGGLLDATLEIMENMLASEVQIITYVAPQGAIAASAGSFILVSGHVAAMSPGSTCGAAMPVTLSPTEGTTAPADDKTVKFLAGHIKSVAELKGRPGETIEKFVTENLTLDAQSALDEGVIDYIASSLEELLQILYIEDADIQSLEMSTRESATNIISNPQVSFILLIAGVYGLIIGFNAPQTFVPEVFGAISLVLGLYGLGLFSVNLFAALLIILGIGLFVAEALTPTYGVLSIGGIVSLVLGVMFLPAEPLMPAVWFVRFKYVSIGIGISASVLMVVLLRGLIKARKAKKVHGADEFIDKPAVVVEELSPEGLIKVQGEIWKAVSHDGTTLPEGQQVKVIKRIGMIAVVEPMEPVGKSEKEE